MRRDKEDSSKKLPRISKGVVAVKCELELL
jgi:hypothetical protein